MIAEHINSSPSPEVLPWDLRHWVPENTLVYLALEAVQEVSASGAPNLKPQGRHAPMFMTLLTYCYGIGMLGSPEIELAAQRDRTIRYLCGNNLTNLDGLRLFRRRNGRLLEKSLANLFVLAWQWRGRVLSGDAMGNAGFEQADLSVRALRDESLIASFATQANLRLQHAIQLDSILLDE